jgi:hypothetical protein
MGGIDLKILGDRSDISEVEHQFRLRAVFVEGASEIIEFVPNIAVDGGRLADIKLIVFTNGRDGVLPDGTVVADHLNLGGIGKSRKAFIFAFEHMNARREPFYAAANGIMIDRFASRKPSPAPAVG